MKFKCDFNYEAWITDLEVEAENEDEVASIIAHMTLADLMENGAYVKTAEATNLEKELVEATYTVKVSSVDYDITEYDIDFPGDDVNAEIEAIKASLPQEMTLEVEVDNGYELDELVADTISDKTGYLINSCEYEVVKIK